MSLTLIMPQGGGARHGGRQQDAVPREKVAIVTQLLSPPSININQLQSSPLHHLLITISMTSKFKDPVKVEKIEETGQKV